MVKCVFVNLLVFGWICGSIAAGQQNASNPNEKEELDATIRATMFDPQNMKKCLSVPFKHKPHEVKANNTKYETPLWTVVILKEEIIKNKTLHIQHCAGSLIHPRIVLTAAHCVFEKPVHRLKIRAGECDRRPDQNSTARTQERRIESVVYQKGYHPIRPRKDIALVFLKNPFRITDYVRTVCLPPSRIQLDINFTPCLATGWEQKGHILAGFANFRKVNMTVIPNERCEKVLRLTGLGENYALDRSFMCAAGDAERNILAGNGGAPLACPVCGVPGKMVQFGIMSWGFSSPPLPDVFTSVVHARHWIMEQVRERKLKLPGCGFHWN